MAAKPPAEPPALAARQRGAALLAVNEAATQRIVAGAVGSAAAMPMAGDAAPTREHAPDKTEAAEEEQEPAQPKAACADEDEGGGTGLFAALDDGDIAGQLDFMDMLDETMERITGTARILINLFQIVSTFIKSLDVPWPSVFGAVMARVSVVNLNLGAYCNSGACAQYV